MLPGIPCLQLPGSPGKESPGNKQLFHLPGRFQLVCWCRGCVGVIQTEMRQVRQYTGKELKCICMMLCFVWVYLVVCVNGWRWWSGALGSPHWMVSPKDGGYLRSSNSVGVMFCVYLKSWNKCPWWDFSSSPASVVCTSHPHIINIERLMCVTFV